MPITEDGTQIARQSFISSMILDKYYKIRVFVLCVIHFRRRQSQAYYERLKYIRVYAKISCQGLDPNVKSVNKDFYIKAVKHLIQGSDWFSVPREFL